MYDHSYWQAAEYAATHPEEAPREQPCEMPGCSAQGLFKAPKSPKELRSYRWFCQPHIQEYNKAWNYFQGLSATQMEHVRREDVVGWRPTWPMGHLHNNPQIAGMDANALRKHIFQRFFGNKAARDMGGAAPAKKPLDPEEQQALVRLGLKWPLSMYELKTRYRVLVKQHHPDAVTAAGNPPDTDEPIKLINRAYAVLKRKLSRKG